MRLPHPLRSGLLATMLLLALQHCTSTKPATATTTPAVATDTAKAGGTEGPYPDNSDTTALAEMDSIRVNEEAPVWAPKKYPYSPSRTLIVDLLHTRVEVSFDWAKKYMPGKATLSFKPYFYPTDSVVLDAKGFTVNQVAVLKQGKATPLQYVYRNAEQLVIKLDRMYSRNEQFDIYVDYVAKPDELKAGGSEAITSDKGLYFINPDLSDKSKPRQIWTQGETQATSCWVPTIDSPNERCTSEILMTVPDTMTTLSNGLLVASKKNADGTRTDHWRQTLPHAPYLFFMGAGNFKVVKDTWQGMEVSYYVEPAYEKYARLVFGRTPQMLQFFSDKLIKYPWAKYSQIVVRDYVSGAMENTTAVSFFEQMHHDDRAHLDETHEDIVAHELFHHWFGDYVTSESWPNLTLNEGFADYSEYLWFEHKYGIDEAEHHREDALAKYLEESTTKREPLIRYHMKHREDMFDAHSYQKGGLVLHMLRKQVGDEAFYEVLKLYLNRHAYKAVEIHQLRHAFEEVTGQDLQWFFDQWYLRAGHPELNLTYSIDSTKQTLSLRVQQLQDERYAPIYSLPMQLELVTTLGSQRVPVWVHTADTTYTMPLPAGLHYADLDPEKIFLARTSELKPLAWWLALLQHSKNYKQRLNAVAKLAEQLDSPEALQALATTATDTKTHWGLRKAALQALTTHKKLAEVLPTLMQAAQQDRKAAVRSTAMEFLTELLAQEEQGAGSSLSAEQRAALEPVFAKGVLDSSYATCAQALTGLYALNKTKALDALKPNIAAKSDALRYAIGLIMMRERAPDAFDYTYSGIKQMANGLEKYKLLMNFGAFLTVCNEQQQLEGVPFLKDMAKNNSTWYIRLAAFRGLRFYAERMRNRDVLDFLKQLRDTETHEQLKQFYQQEL